MFLTLSLWFIGGLIFLGSVVFLFTPYRFFSRRTNKLINKIPGPKAFPFFGSIFEYNLKHEEILPKVIETLRIHGPVCKLWMLGVPHVLINDPDDIQVIVSNKEHMDKSDVYKFLHPWLGTGLLTSTGDKWHSRRRILTPAFHFKVLEDYVHVFNSKSAVLVDLLKDESTVDITRLVTLCTLDIICEAAMGTSVNAQHNGDMAYISAVRRMGELYQHRYISLWLYQDVVFHLSPTAREQKKVLSILHSFSRKVIRQRRAEYLLKADKPSTAVEGKRKRLTFLDLLIEVSEREGSLSEADIQEEVDTFMFEGHDTTAYAISWAIFLLGHHQEIQERVYAELVEIFGDDPRPATTADLMSMHYLEQVIKEALRLYPSVPAISRTLTRDAQIKNYTLPPGVQVIILPYVVHRNPEVYPDPETFDPERFSPENSIGRHPFSYIPFSAGPRNCIGQRFALLEEKTVLSTLLRNFKFRSLQARESVQVLTEMILKPKDGLLVQVERRS